MYLKISVNYYYYYVLKGECQAIASQTGIGRRSRSKVRVRVAGWTSMGWVEAFEAWGVALEALVVNIPDELKDIRPLLTTVPITTPQDAHTLLPLGPWEGCMLANLASPQDSDLVSSLFKQWRPAIAILSIHGSVSRVDTISMMPSAPPAFYQKKIITICHQDIGGVTSARWRFIHYMRWQGVQSWPSLMTRDTLPWTLQTALSDTIGATRGRTFELRTGLEPPEAIGVLSSSPQVGGPQVRFPPVFFGIERTNGRAEVLRV